MGRIERRETGPPMRAPCLFYVFANRESQKNRNYSSLTKTGSFPLVSLNTTTMGELSQSSALRPEKTAHRLGGEASPTMGNDLCTWYSECWLARVPTTDLQRSKNCERTICARVLFSSVSSSMEKEDQ